MNNNIENLSKSKDIKEDILKDIPKSDLYFNRELSWLEFNRRVLEEALNPSNPLIERVKFLSIFSTNLDEFFMIRVAGLMAQIDAGVGSDLGFDGLSPLKQLQAIRAICVPMQEMQRKCLTEEILPSLEKHDVFIKKYHELSETQKALLRTYFRKQIFPILTPLAVDVGRPFPHISNLSRNLAIILKRKGDKKSPFVFARLKIPETFPRFINVLDTCRKYRNEDFGGSFEIKGKYIFVLLEDLIQSNMDLLFPGMEIVESYNFRVTRDADIEISEDEASDLLSTIEQGVKKRRFGQVVRLAVNKHMPEGIVRSLADHLEVDPICIYKFEGWLGLGNLMQFVSLELPELKFPPFVPRLLPIFENNANIFNVIKQKDILLHHPYDSFQPVVDFFKSAAKDQNVVAIKSTLYRVGPNSGIVEALLEAGKEDKQVAVLVELKARFDEENNIGWARSLESQGVHVVYGLVGLKTHAKATLVVRRERDGMRRYVHLSSGNYNATTARFYTDIGFLTCNPDIADDVTTLFNRLTGFAPEATYSKLLVAPEKLRNGLLSLLDREIQNAKDGKEAAIIWKCNALVDRESIDRLYTAARYGVQVKLIVRGVCCLRPGIKDISDKIEVISIIGRYLEHSRVYWFSNNGNPEVFIGSADIMERNLDRRIETVFPIQDPVLKKYIKEKIIDIALNDNVKARVLQNDGKWILKSSLYSKEGLDKENTSFSCQQWHMDNPRDLGNKMEQSSTSIPFTF